MNILPIHTRKDGNHFDQNSTFSIHIDAHCKSQKNENVLAGNTEAIVPSSHENASLA